jgi:hypothetical protein
MSGWPEPAWPDPSSLPALSSPTPAAQQFLDQLWRNHQRRPVYVRCAFASQGCNAFLAYDSPPNVNFDHTDPHSPEDAYVERIFMMNGWRLDVNIQALGLQLRWVITGYVSAAGAVLMSWLCVVSGMIAGCVRCAAGAFRGSA